MSISPAMSGVLHENHKALIARGPWRFDVMEPARYVATPGGGERPATAGSCDICGQAICDVVRFVSKSGERIMLGLDCANTFECNNAKAFRDAKTGLMRIKREATARRKGEKLAVVLAPLRAEMDAWVAERAGTFHAEVAANALRVLDKGRRLSPAHMALVERLRTEEPQETRSARYQREKAEREARQPVETPVDAPEGTMTVRGVVVAYKAEQKSFNGSAPRWCYRMTVKVATDAGVWLANGTIPQALFDAAEKALDYPDGLCEALKGCGVEFTATIERSADRPQFGFYSRPSKARLVSWPAEKTAPVREHRDEEAA